MRQAFSGWIRTMRGRGAVLAGFCAPFVCALIFLAAGSTASRGQQASGLGGLGSGALQQIQQELGLGGQGGGLGGGFGAQQPQQPMLIQPVMPPAGPPLPPSRLEQILSARAGASLQQFGYDQLGRASSVTVPQTGAVDDAYVLGPGDEIDVSLRGQENGQFQVTVDRNGQVVLPRLSPIPAMGRTFGDFQKDLQAAIHRAYVATDATVTVGQIRQISVLVSGEVNSPGQRLVTGLSSVVDALLLSGGVKKTGSLRNIRILRGGHSYTVDLYNVLTDLGSGSTFRLADGDRIVVPPLGRTVAVTGLVRRPGIFELAPHQSTISVRALLALAGGQEVRGRYRLSVLRVLPDGRSDMTALSGVSGAMRDSDILFVQLGADQTISRATLSGGIGLAGNYSITNGTKLSSLLKAPGALGQAPYTLFGIISRKDPRTLLRTLIAFTPVAVLNGGEDMTLQSDDIIRPLSVTEMQLVTSTVQNYLMLQQSEQEAQRNPLANDLTGSGWNPSGLGGTTTGSIAGLNDVMNQRRDINAVGGNATAAGFGSMAGNQAMAGTTPGIAIPPQGGMPSGGAAGLASQQPYAMGQSPYGQSPYGQSPYGQTPGQAIYGQGAYNSSASPFNGQFSYGQNPYGQQGQQPLPGLQTPGAMGQSAYPYPNPYAGGGLQMPGAMGQSAYPYSYPFAGPYAGNQQPAPNFEQQYVPQGGVPTNQEIYTFGDLAQQLGVDPLVLVNFLIDHQVTLDGAVRGPGTYIVGPNVSLQDLVQAAGGTINWADRSGVELISTTVDPTRGSSSTQLRRLPLQQGMLANYVVKPHDEFRFNQVFTDADIGSVTLQGEVRFTGTYQITRGEHLSELLARAGGLTNTAYPYGTVFLRKSAAQRERDSYLRAAKEVEDQLLAAMTRVGNDKIMPDTFTAMQQFVTDLRNQKAMGRISITADPSVLAAKPALDPLLEPGDLIYIPPRPSTVSVLGQVQQPGSFPYRAGESLHDYLTQAGGFNQLADESDTFLVLPDGTARKIEKSWFSFGSTTIPPGSVIVVPRDVTPLDLRQTIIDVSQIFSQFAVSIASIAVLSRE